MFTENNPAPGLKSRWGYHPCTYEVYGLLKDLHRWYWQTVYDFHRWHRWQRKQPQNRVGPEPVFCELFVEDTVWYKPCRRGDEVHFKVYPKMLIDHDVVDLYRKARTPMPESCSVFDAAMFDRIALLHKEVGMKLK